MRECDSEVEQEDEGRLTVAQDILRKSTDFLRRIITPVTGQGGVSLSHVCPPCHRHPLADLHPVGFQRGTGKKQCNWWRAACGGQYTWKNSNRVLLIEDSADPSEAKVFRDHAPLQGAYENLVHSLKLWTNQQTVSDSLVHVLVEGLQEHCRMKVMDEFRRFINVDDYETVGIGDWEKNSEALHVVGPPHGSLKGGGQKGARRVWGRRGFTK